MRSLLVIVILFATAGAAFAVDPGDPEQGYAYAKENCTECHAIDRGDYDSPFYGAPPFSEVANVRAMSELALFSFFQTPHPTMPNLIVPSDDVRNLIAYIRSLRK